MDERYQLRYLTAGNASMSSLPVYIPGPKKLYHLALHPALLFLKSS